MLHLARLLRPGGSVYLEIPNARCVDFLLHDGHFGEFGVTLLPPAPSVAWLRRRLAQPDAVLYAALAYYLALLSREGLATRLANELPNTAELEALSATLSVKFDEFETRLGGFAGGGTGEADAGGLALLPASAGPMSFRKKGTPEKGLPGTSTWSAFSVRS